MGRPPKPTALKILTGNPGKRPLNLLEPKPPGGCEMPPTLLSNPRAVEHWNREAPRLLAMGVLTQVDSRAFGRLCRLWAHEDRVGLLADETGSPIPLDPRIMSEIRQLEERFGMNPSSRVKLKVDQPKPASRLAGIKRGAAS
jgi:phage terminase small subunit